MAIQKSVLNESIISELLLKQYGISTERAERIGLGTANCYRICSQKRKCFLKEYQGTFSEEDLQREVRLNDFLVSASFPTAAFIPNIDGNRYIRFCDRYIVLQEYIEGKSYADHNLPDEILFQAADLLGELHEILRGYELPVKMDRTWVEKFSVKQACDDYDMLLDRVKEIGDKAVRERIREDLVFKKELLSRIEPYGRYFDKVHYKPTHGDYSAMQYLCADGEITAVIDFASATRLPAVWELMRSYMQSAVDMETPEKLDVEKFCAYVRRYLRVSSLSKEDLRGMPYIYLYQLGRSRYGYKEYLANVENRDALLKFAFWRTDTCRMLARRADEISQMLMDL